VGRALTLLDRDALDLRNRTLRLLEALPGVDPRALHALGDRLYGVDPAPLAAFVDTVNGWLHARLTAGGQSVARLAQLAEVWEKINTAARDAEQFNLERKPLVFNVFGWLAEASCR
jgi:DNA polymerase-3 subunit delta'